MTENAAPTYAEPMNPDEVGGPPPGPVGDSDFTTGFDDYWGVDETTQFVFPDKRQYLIIRKLTEGQRAKLEKDSNQDLRVDRDQSTTIKIDPGRNRKALLKAAISGWNMFRKNAHTGEWQAVEFKEAHLNSFIDGADPKLVDNIQKAIREFNPFLKNDLTVEEIEKEIAELNKELEQAKAREAGE